MGEVGRPLKWKSVQALQKAIDKYFNGCWEDVPVIGMYGPVYKFDDEGNKTKEILTQRKQVRPYTVTGLAVHLGMTRQMLLEYEERDEFQDAIKHAKQRCQQFAEEQLYLAKNATGAIFSLKNNWDWRDKTEQEVTVKGGFAVRLQQAKERRLANERIQQHDE